MNNIVEFVVRMKDLMGGNLNRLGSQSQATFNRMAQHADRVSGRNRVLGQSFNELQRRINNVETTIRTSTIPSQIRAARRELEALQRQSSRHQGNLSSGVGSGNISSGGIGIGGMAMGNMLGGFALNAASAFLGAVKDGIGAAISGSMQKEKDIIGLSTFIGEKGANDAYKNIRKDAEVTPFDTASLLKVNRALISSGLNAKDARQDAMNLANAISATGGGNDELMRMAINMQQIKSLGKASAMDVKQFGYAGINIYALLAKASGKSIDQVKGMDVSYDLLAKSLAMARGEGGLYAGALEKMGKTMSGKWEQVKDRSANALTDIGDAFAPVINKVLDVAIKMSSYVAPLLAMAQPYIDAISTGLGIAIEYVMSLGSGTGSWGDYLSIVTDWISVVWKFLKGVSFSVWKIVSGIIEWIGKSEIIKDVIWFIGGIFENIIFKCVQDIGELLVWIWESVLKPILEGLEMAYKWVKEMLGASDNTLTIEVKKTTGKPKPETPKTPTEPTNFADLTRFKDTSVLGAGTEVKEKNKKKSKEAGDTISGGGQKNITINLGKFFDNIQFTTMNMKESEQDIERILMECMGRILYNGAKNG